MKKKQAPFPRRKGRLRDLNREGPMPAGSQLGDGDGHSEEAQAARQRDSEPDDFDSGTDVADDRVRGAGGQSLAELVITKEQGWGLEEGGGGLRFDQPEPNVNDYDPDEPTEVDPESMTAEEFGEEERKPRSA